ncbi:MAG TPA: DUF3570 domain-containing protein [Myxococcaceae bacterium]|nr:DUF3570 domain-containing protein [Myxococcaceae bacterium]
MQLNPERRPSPLRNRLGAAACLLLASGVPAVARADADSTATWRLESTGLVYGERSRTKVLEPIARITRLYPSGQTLSAQVALDVITGASPTGALPSNSVQTTTSASGRSSSSAADEVPTNSFGDFRVAGDLEWQRPLGRLLTATTGTHYSHEKDYQSLGLDGKLSLEFLQRLTTLTVGAGVNHDGVFPHGGTHAGLSDGSVVITRETNPKDVTTGLVGLSRILTRRWMVSADLSRALERGYLTEPYKVVSLFDPQTGDNTGQVTEKRPNRRTRSDVLLSSVYHFDEDVLYLSYRNYWDDWGVASATYDVKYRIELDNHQFVQPHVRFYHQSAARFFTFGLPNGPPLPDFATSDYRLGALRTLTVGATYGFRLPSTPGEWTVSAEYIRQFGDGYPGTAVGSQQQVDLFPALDIGSVVVGYTLEF